MLSFKEFNEARNPNKVADWVAVFSNGSSRTYTNMSRGRAVEKAEARAEKMGWSVVDFYQKGGGW